MKSIQILAAKTDSAQGGSRVFSCPAVDHCGNMDSDGCGLWPNWERVHHSVRRTGQSAALNVVRQEVLVSKSETDLFFAFWFVIGAVLFVQGLENVSRFGFRGLGEILVSGFLLCVWASLWRISG
jgi:hypothetical protein